MIFLSLSGKSKVDAEQQWNREGDVGSFPRQYIRFRFVISFSAIISWLNVRCSVSHSAFILIHGNIIEKIMKIYFHNK